MDLISNLLEGFAAVFNPILLLTLLVGVLIGSIVGVLPGIGPVGAMALLLPISFTLDPAAGLIMTSGIYLGAQYGGSTSAILIGVPGEASSVVTTLDGYPMAKKGRAGAALAIAALSSFLAGTLAVVLLMVVAGPLSDFATQFASPEYLMLAIFALVALSRLTGGSTIMTFAAVGLGLILATIGLDATSGNVRFTFGLTPLLQGIEITSVAVGLFGISEILLLAEGRGTVQSMPKVPFRSLWPNRTELRRSVGPAFRGGIIGFVLGLIPGPSGAVSSYGSYALEKRISKRKDEFGKGAVEGVAGPEAANNGSAGGSMVPLLVLGLPFNGPTALLLAGFTVQGIIPGPLFMENEPVLFWTLIAGLYAANLALLALNLPLVGMFTSLLRIPRDLLLTFVVVIAIIGTIATRGQLVDVFWLLVMGVIGYLMAKLGISRVAVMLAFVIAPILESSLTQTVSLADGDPLYLFDRPISTTIIIMTALIAIVPVVLKAIAKKRHQRSVLDLEVDAS
ncbi:tripartite tricarboxylate transporter permease [Cryobacterium tagatosivorans]|uniref:Tripartite tricarboxylate transporter permease n=1 Tax=Cryobacterium tagatosivorans TaxID=1259199 RepID=A0A4R8UIV1_9MICO|nr:tripartite tricarboxylate transporter permease [Cryobacterium tagatosivorans]TFB53614.1 tripartite tricarboxylate transporter permease [Cryobacterium tagatosivorans]